MWYVEPNISCDWAKKAYSFSMCSGSDTVEDFWCGPKIISHPGLEAVSSSHQITDKNAVIVYTVQGEFAPIL